MEQQTKTTALKVGDYIKSKFGDYALIVSLDEDGDPNVVDTNGDETVWGARVAEVVTIHEVLAETNQLITPRISQSYNAVIDFTDKIVRVGCQRVKFETIMQLAELIRTEAIELRK